MKRLEMPGNVSVTLQVWDIGGQSIFGKMIQTYIFEANAVSVNYYLYFGILRLSLCMILQISKASRI